MNINTLYIFIGYIILSLIIMFIIKLLSNKNIINIHIDNGDSDNITIVLIGFFWFLIIPASIVFMVLYFVLKIPFMLVDLICRNKK